MEVNKIYVIYVGVSHIDYNDSETLGKYIEIIKDSLIPTNLVGEVIIIPQITTPDTRIECINPEYITDKELIRKHRLMLDILHEQIDKFKENE